MVDSTQPGDKGEYEECVDATVLARNVLLRTHGFSPYQHVFGGDPELSFDVLVPGADVAAVTMLVLDRPSKRAVQIRQEARKAFVESQDDKAMRRALVARHHLHGETSKLEIKLRSGERAKVGECDLDTLVGMAEQLFWLCVRVQRMCGSLTDISCFKVSQEQLRMATVTERVADEVIHQELRAIGENSAADGQVLPKYLDIPVPWSGSSGEKRSLESMTKKNKSNSALLREVNFVCLCLLRCQTMVMRFCGANLWSMTMKFLRNWTAEIGELQEVTTEQLLQGARRKRKGSDKGSNVHEKSLIWAAKDTEWKKLQENEAVRILTGASAEKAKAQFGDRLFQVFLLSRAQGPMVSARVSGS